MGRVELMKGFAFGRTRSKIKGRRELSLAKVDIFQQRKRLHAKSEKLHSPFLRSLGAEPMPRDHYLPLLAGSGERRPLPQQSLPARRLL